MGNRKVTIDLVKLALYILKRCWLVVICAAIGTSMGVSPLLTGGAVLSGAFFGDRCSPVSTSALLVAAVTKTDIYDNIRRMVKTAFVPFLLACGIYAGIGLTLPREGSVMDLEALFSRSFRLHWTALIPAAAILSFIYHDYFLPNAEKRRREEEKQGTQS